MKVNTKKIVLISSIVAIAAAASAAMANEGKVSFEGGVTSSTCDVSVNKQGKDATIKLPTVSNTLLKKAGDTAGRMLVNFALSNCTLADGKTKAGIYFVAGSNINNDGRLINTESTGTKNVDLQILNGDLKAMDLSLGVGAQGGTPEIVDRAAGTASIRHYAQYYATGTGVTAGGLKANVEYEINYE